MKAQNLELKICLLCGDKFTPKEERNLYCKKRHYKKCPICNEQFFLKKNRDKLTCSAKCASIYRVQNVRYDCICKLCGKEFKGKTKKANVCEDPHYNNCEICDKRYIYADNHRPSRFCSPSCQAKVSHTPEAKENRRKKSLERHGVESPFQAKEVIYKIKESLDNSEKDMRVGSKRWIEMLDNKYGVENISQLEEIQLKKEETYMKKFGVKNPAAIHINNYNDWDKLEDFLNESSLDCLELSHYFGVSIDSIRAKAKILNIGYMIKDFYKYSNPELIVKHILTDIGFKEGLDFIPHYRKLIGNLEVDFYIPKHNLAIEVSPTFTHTTAETKYGNKIDKNYHKMKFDLCREKGVHLLTLFEWIDPETAISNAINKSTRKGDTIVLDLSVDYPHYYENKGYVKIEEYLPKCFYHNISKGILIKSNKTIKKHREKLENNSFFPIYNCGYEKWVLPENLFQEQNQKYIKT